MIRRHIINWVISPTVWVVAVILMAAALDVYLNWRVVLLIVFAQLASDLIDAFFEGRPLNGPRRWEK